MNLPTKDGPYVVVFGEEGDLVISTHSLDLFQGNWWDGSEIVDKDHIQSMADAGHLYGVQLIPLADDHG